MAGGTWGFLTILAPILILAAIGYALFTNSRRSAGHRRREEEGARQVYAEQERADDARHRDDAKP